MTSDRRLDVVGAVNVAVAGGDDAVVGVVAAAAP